MGHMMLHNDKEEYGNGVGYVFNNFNASSQVNKVAEIEEEFEAWKIGYDLSKKLNLKIERNNYELFKAKLITTYFTWSIRNRFNSSVSNIEKDLKKIQDKVSKIKI